MTFGFIITRHVNSENTNKYWNQCVKLLRIHYPDNQIIIIDDNSVKELVKADNDYKNLHIIESEYIGRGELLPYIYFLKNKWFDNAVIIHDSVFFHKTYNFKDFDYDVSPLWYFDNNDSEIDNILRITNSLNNSDIIKKAILNWNKHNWYSCFGAMCYINYEFLNNINNKYNITNLIEVVRNRNDRCALERIFGVIFSFETRKRNCILGNINMYYSKVAHYGYSFHEYIELFNKKKVLAPVIKVWTGR